MEVISYFACVALGIAIDATYHRLNKIAEQKAYDRGYKKGRKEALKEIKPEEEPYSVETEQPRRRIHVIPESFMEQLHNHGRAAMKFGGANNE